MATALQSTKEWQTLCDLQGFDPAVLLNYTCIIPTFGGAATTAKVAQWGAAPSQANTMESLSIPWDCVVVGATVKYLNGNVAGGCVVAATGALKINCTSAAGTLISATASIASGTTSTLIDLANAEISGKHFQKSATGLSVGLNAGTQLFISSLVMTAAVDTGPVPSDLSVTLQLAVPQSKFVLPTVS
tara:strand:+ start:4108 stop:4671 length:564 start_codon:yes stop_codon:yes gene_type:complete